MPLIGQIVAAVEYHDAIYVFTSLGIVLRMTIDPTTQQPLFEMVHTFS
jgi:hypothetical protein